MNRAFLAGICLDAAPMKSENGLDFQITDFTGAAA
jgi:hypothetical protein